MSKLTDTTKRTRRYVLYFLIFVIVVLVIQFVIRYASGGETPLSGTSSPYSYANKEFGDIIYPSIPSLAIAEGSKPSFTVLGQFSDSPTSVNVYRVDKPRETLGSTVKAKDLATALSFNSTAINQDQTLKWNEGGKELVFNKLTENSTYQNSVLRNSSFSKPEFVDTAEVDSLISSLSSTLKFPYTSEAAPKEYLLRSGNSYATTTAANNSDFIKAGYFQSFEIVSLRSTTGQTNTTTTANTVTGESVDGRIYFNNPTEASYSIVVSNEVQGTSTQDRKPVSYIVEFANKQVQVDTTAKASYQLKSAEKAWEEVKDGKASLRYLLEEGGNQYAEYQTATINRFTVDPELSELGFYAPDEWTGYIYPIYIFKGNAELSGGKTARFMFFVKAIE